MKNKIPYRISARIIINQGGENKKGWIDIPLYTIPSSMVPSKSSDWNRYGSCTFIFNNLCPPKLT